MAKIHGGSGVRQGHLNRGTAPKPSPIHHGSGKPVGVLHAPPPRGSPSLTSMGPHGGTNLPRTLKRK